MWRSDAEEARPTTSASGATSTTTATPCGEEDAEAVTLTTQDGTELNAVLVGDGEVGVVLGHQLRSDFCSWVPFAKQLVERHMRARAINFASTSPDDDMVAGSRELRRRGAKRIILVGASMGGTAALVAAAKIDVAGVAALSAPRQFSGLELSLLSAASRSERSFSSDGKTGASLATPVGSTKRRSLATRLWSRRPALSTGLISFKIPKPSALSSIFSWADRTA
jgi:pimeloyl-ACP methyl ester carboxylesterase